ncbi:hypothetical protein BW895_26615, partial [Bacillus cereus]
MSILLKNLCFCKRSVYMEKQTLWKRFKKS